MNELAGQCLGGYQLEEEIGRGSMGLVYRGRQIVLGREVAVKVLSQTLARDASYVARFIREAQIIAGLNHPNIVQIFDAGQQNGLLYFVMEYVQGPTIASLLQIDDSLPQHIAAEYAAQIADALDSAYSELNIIHRDIKPENLMLDRWGKIKIMDFGLARATWHQKITIAKTLVGSIYYASPEQVWGHALDNRSDIYALGVVLYEMVSGHRPFVGRSLPELTQAIIGGTVQPPSIHNPRPGAIPASSIHTNDHRPSQVKGFIQPPKRPQPPMQQYRSVDLEITQIPPGEAITPPLLTRPPSAFNSEIARTREQEIDTEGPTGPLNHDTQQPSGYKLLSQSKPTKRRRFWRKLFRSSHLEQ